MGIERKQILQKAGTQHLVHGVVTADVFADNDQPPVSVENSSSMQAAGLGKSLLHRPQARWQLRQNLGGNSQARLHGREMLVHRINRGFAAQPTTGRGKYVPCELLKIDSD